MFIDASEMGYMEDRVHRVLTDEDIQKIATTYHNWRKLSTEYKDVKGYCKSASYKEIEKQGFVLTPGRYVGIADVQDDEISFEEKMTKLTATLAEQFEKEQLMNEEIKKQLAKIGFEI